MNIIWKGAGSGEYTANSKRAEMATRIVLHRMLGSLAGTAAWFAMAADKRPGKAPSSANYGIGLDGTIHQYVRESDIAYAQGIQWNGDQGSAKCLMDRPRVNPNAYCLSIEHEGFSGDPWPEAMKNSSAWLIGAIARRWSIPLDRDHVIGHGEIYRPKVATCPGPTCPWSELLRRAAEVPLENK